MHRNLGCQIVWRSHRQMAKQQKIPEKGRLMLILCLLIISYSISRKSRGSFQYFEAKRNIWTFFPRQNIAPFNWQKCFSVSITSCIRYRDRKRRELSKKETDPKWRLQQHRTAPVPRRMLPTAAAVAAAPPSSCQSSTAAAAAAAASSRAAG